MYTTYNVIKLREKFISTFLIVITHFRVEDLYRRIFKNPRSDGLKVRSKHLLRSPGIDSQPGWIDSSVSIPGLQTFTNTASGILEQSTVEGLGTEED